MNARSMKRLSGTADIPHFVNEVTEMLAPYGSVRRSKVVVERQGRDAAAPSFTDVLCFIEMDTPQQAEAARKGLDLLLLGGNHLFFSVQQDADFAG